jgi:hypothetical protein
MNKPAGAAFIRVRLAAVDAVVDLDRTLSMTLEMDVMLNARRVAAILVAAAASGFAAPAQAQSYPWCLLSLAYEGGENCSFMTSDQCMATRLGIGGFCQVNNQYQATGAAASHRAFKTHSGKPS